MDYNLILALINLAAFFAVIILIKLIYRHDPHRHWQYGDEIILFHSEDRYKKRVFRFHLIENLKDLKIRESIDKLELKVVLGELGPESLEIIKHAANNKFESITIIVGPKVV